MTAAGVAAAGNDLINMATAYQKSLPPIAVTMGDPAGIGPDVTLACWMRREKDSLPPFVVIGDPRLLAKRAGVMGLEIQVVPITSAREAAANFSNGLPVMPAGDAGATEAGKPTPDGGAAAIAAIEAAVALVQRREVRAIVTNPINKEQLYDIGFAHPGHTEFLAALAQEASGEPVEPEMMLACDELKVVPVTRHILLSDVSAKLTKALIKNTILVTAEAMQSMFGISGPLIAVAGLNPHAGEGGNMGREEIDVIGPAIESARAAGCHVVGPLSADTMFHAAAREGYDAAVAMYHDQALIPIKTLAFDRAVNMTLGLPFVRTSPDHGTAYAIAGSGEARPDSLLEALKLAHAASSHLATLEV